MPARPSPRSGFVLFRLGAIEIAVHPSWLLMFAVVAIIAHTEITPDVVSRDSGLAPLLSIGIALLFYGFVLGHELSHAVVARAYGIDAKRITLFIFGGVAQIGSEAQKPAHEYHIALAGPLASLIIACVLAAVSRLLHPGGTGYPGLWGYLAGVNLALAAFNLIPAFPLDGGRLLRAGLWAGFKDRVKATRWAAASGKGFAFLLMGAGGAIVGAGLFASDGASRADAPFGLWYVAIGYFIYSIARASGRAEGGAQPRTGPPESSRDLFDGTVRAPEPPVTVRADEGEAEEPDADHRRAGPAQRPGPARPPADKP